MTALRPKPTHDTKPAPERSFPGSSAFPLLSTSSATPRTRIGIVGGLVAVLAMHASAGDALRDRIVVLQHVRVESPGVAPVEDATIVIRDGVVREIAPGAAVPFDAKVLDGAGLTVAPAFVDAWSLAFSAEPPKREIAVVPKTVDEGVVIGMDPVARSGRTPETRAELALPWKDARKWREAGFGAFLGVPVGSGIRGQSVVGWLIDEAAPAAEATLARDVFVHVDLSVNGPAYPSTQMGVLAAYRQFFLDADRNGALWSRYEQSGRSVERPALDAGFAELEKLRAAKRRFVFRADSAGTIRASLAFAREFGLEVAIAGGAEAAKVIPELQAAHAFVLLGIDFPKKSDDESATPENPGDGHGDHDGDERGMCCDELTSGAPSADAQDAKPAAPAAPGTPGAQEPAPAPNPEQGAVKPPGEGDKKPDAAKAEKKKRPEVPAAIRAERDAERAERIATAAKLEAARVPFAFTAKDLKAPADFRANLKLAIEGGLPRDAALAALTSRAGELLGVEDVVGSVAKGRTAALAAFAGDPLDPASKVRFLILGDQRFEFEPPKDVPKKNGAKLVAAGTTDVTGTWQMKVDMGDSAREYEVTFDQKDGRLSGTTISGTGTSGEISSGSVGGDTIEFTIVIAPAGRHYEFTYGGKVAGDQMSGTVSINGGEGHPWSATRTSKPQGRS